MQNYLVFIRSCQKILFPPIDLEYFTQKIETLFAAQTLVRVSYFFMLFASIGIFTIVDLSLKTQFQISPMWPVFWIEFVEFPIAITFISLFFIVTSFISSIWPEKRIFRIFAFLGLLEFVAFYASFLKLDVDWYVFIVIAFFLILLPDGWNNPKTFPQINRQKFLLTFWGCQAFLLLTYSMSGIGKVTYALIQTLQGKINIFSPQAGSFFISERLFTTGATSPLGPLIISNYWLGWPFMVWSVYLLFFSFFIAFRPALHKLWGIGLIFFHLASYLTMNIGFSIHIFLISLFFLSSPFQIKDTRWQDIVFQLPLFGWIIRKSWIKKK